MGMIRGTSLEVYIKYASNSVLTPMARLGPNRNVQSWTTTKDLPITIREAASTDDDDHCLNNTTGGVGEGDAFVLPPHDWKQRNRSADHRDRQEHLEESPENHPSVSARAGDDVAGVVQDRALES